ncbi:MAG: DUF374 domain-containing protein [Puniceicoccales bacterium]|jgi:lysophospholipid acyltransferase (LPLAT)-like uncharacterized protein|nr:DUF374 domain-containing protein [Puniceicoccales bacterium]
MNATPSGRRVKHLRWPIRLALRPLALLVRLWLRTLRIHTRPADLRAWHDAPPGRLVILWHNRLLVAAELHRRHSPRTPISGLISASRDGAWLATFFRLLDIGAIRGSSSWRGAPATREILHRLHAGEDIGITPDGPRGPCYDWKPGFVQIAAAARCPIVLLGTHYHCARRLATWDRFYIPAPFSRVDLTVEIIPADSPLRTLPTPELSAHLRERLNALTDDNV